MGMSYSDDDVKRILKVQELVYKTNYLVDANDKEVITVLLDMKKYIKIWPEKTVSELEKISEKISEEQKNFDNWSSISESQAPCFHHAHPLEIIEYEESPDRASESLKEINGLKDKRRSILMEKLNF